MDEPGACAHDPAGPGGAGCRIRPVEPFCRADRTRYRGDLDAPPWERAVRHPVPRRGNARDQGLNPGGLTG